ncbi:MAG: hypothetical protein AAFU72_00920 [Pseudomonadota bacterium]
MSRRVVKPAKHHLIELTERLQERIDTVKVDGIFRLKDLLAEEWGRIDNKAGLDAIFARYVTRGGRFQRVAEEPGNLPENRLYRRTA